jgi:hypothetical protein
MLYFQLQGLNFLLSSLTNETCFSSAFRCNFLLDNVIEKVLTLTRRKEKYLVAAAVRFVRTILSRHVSHLDGTDPTRERLWLC